MRSSTRLSVRPKQYRVGDPMEPETEMGPLVSDSHWRDVKSLVDAGLGEGAA